MFFTYVIIFIFFIFLTIVILYSIRTFILPKKIEEIARMIDAGQTKPAMKKLDEILEKDDRNSYAHYLMAEAYTLEKNIKYAIVEYRQVVKRGRYDERCREADVRSKLASLYKESNSIEEAKKEYLILTKIEPDNFMNYYELALIFYNTGVLDKAQAFFKKCLEINSRHDMSQYYLGQIYYRNNIYPDAKQSFINAIKIDPKNYRAHYFLGLVLRQIGDYEWAVKEFEVAQKSEELKVRCFLAKGSCHMEKDQYQKAVMEFERGLKFARRGSDTELNLRYYLAECNEKARDIHSAIHQWEKIIEIKSDFKDVQAKLKNYSDFRQDDRIKDFLIAGLSQFEHISRKIIEAMSFTITDVDIISDVEIEIIATEASGKWRNTRQTNRIIRIIRTTDTIQEKILRALHESMKEKNATRIIVISTGDFSQPAIDFANTRPIELYGKLELINMLKNA